MSETQQKKKIKDKRINQTSLLGQISGLLLKYTTVLCIVYYVFSVLVTVDYVSSATLSVGLVKPLIDLNATVLSFFGLIAVFICTYYYTNTGELRRDIKKHEIEEKHATGEEKEKVSELKVVFERDYEELRETKHKVFPLIILGAICLLCSLIGSWLLYTNAYAAEQAVVMNVVIDYSNLFSVAPDSLTGRVMLGYVFCSFNLGIVLALKSISVFSDRDQK